MKYKQVIESMIKFSPHLYSRTYSLKKTFLWFDVRKTRCFLYVSYSMALFINTVYLGNTANVGVTLEPVLAKLLLSVMYLFPAQEPYCMGAIRMSGIYYRPLSVAEQPLLLQGSSQSWLTSLLFRDRMKRVWENNKQGYCTTATKDVTIWRQ